MNQNALVGRRRRAEDCTPYRPQICHGTGLVGRVTPCAPSWQSKTRRPNTLVSRTIRRCDEPERVGWQAAARRGLHALPTADLPWHWVGRARHSVYAAPATSGRKISPASPSRPAADQDFDQFPVPTSEFGLNPPFTASRLRPAGAAQK